MKNTRVLVTGGAGVIGRALVGLLIQQGAQVWVGDLRPCPLEWIGKLQYWRGDLNYITQQEILSFDPEIVFLLAATFERAVESYSFFEENFHHNMQLSHILAHHLRFAPSLKRIVFASSYLIYDSAQYQFVKPSKIPFELTEDSPIYPRNLCGAAKLFHEMELRFLNEFSSEQFSYISTRIFRVFGYGSQDVISRWIRAALANESLLVYSPEGCFDYIFADDVAEGLLKLAVTKHTGIINLGTGRSRTVQNVLDILQAHFPSLQVELQESSLLYESSQASVSRLSSWIDWIPTHTLETAIPKIILFEEKQKTAKALNRSFGILVTSISKKTPLLNAVRTAAQKLGFTSQIYGCDQQSCIGQYQVDHFWCCPSLHVLNYRGVIDYCQKNSIKAIIPTSDADVEFYAHHAESFHEAGIFPLVSSIKSIQICRDKKLFADLLGNENFPVIPTFLSIEECKARRYVVKARKGAGSHHLGLDLTQSEAILYSQQMEEAIFQPYLDGKEWSVDIFRTLSGTIKGSVARQRNYVVKGESQVTTTQHYPALQKLCETIAHRLDLRGHLVFQVIEDIQGAFHVIECNPRFGGASTASIAVGLDSFFWFLLECLGENLDFYPFHRSSKEIRQIRYPADQLQQIL
jgi:carbamoyl-phosphate synthase large subunit